MAGFFEEVQRRKVYRVAVAYVIAGGGIIQLASAAFPAWDLPEWSLRLVIVLLLIGFPIALILAWAYDVTPSGIQTTPPAPTSSLKGRRQNVLFLGATGIIVSLAAGFFVLPGAIAHRVEKSIAVLPFTNLSDNKENAYFADGVQDDVLTNLYKISDLKVISRTSVMSYRGQTSKIKEIGKALGVATILEGSVRRSGNQVRINVQLIDAATDEHLWAEDYDGDVTDAFKAQTYFAEKIAGALKAKLSPGEKARLDRPPTENDAARLAFQEAHNLQSNNPQDGEKLKESAAKYEEAIKLDENFGLALAYYSYLESWIYHSFEHTAAHRDKARELATKALAIDRSMPEAHLAQGFVLYYVDSDFDGAAREFEIARAGLPNQADVYLALGAIKRRQGKWDESTENLKKAVGLNPNDSWTIHNLAVNYQMLRDFKSANATIDHAIAINPKDPAPWEIKLKILIDGVGDLETAQQALEQFQGSSRPDIEIKVSLAKASVLLLRRQYAEALKVAEQLPDSKLADEPADRCNKYGTIGHLKRLLHDEDGARRAFTRAREAAQAQTVKQPDDPFAYANLALSDASLGNRDAAIAAITQAKKLLPEGKDSFNGPDLTETEAEVYATLGDSATAVQIIERLLQKPGSLTVTSLKINPLWDKIRNDPGFQKLISARETKA